MDSFLLLPCSKPSGASKQVLLRNGEVYCQGEGKVWRDTDQHARKLVNIRDENQDVKIRDIQYCTTLNAFFFLIDGYSGVFANPVSSSLCMPLGFGRLSCGLRVAQPVRTSGPRTTCMDMPNSKVCAGDAWGAVAVWSLDGKISDPPLWTFGAHDGIGCSSVALVDDYNLVITIGGIHEQVKIWSLEDDGEVRLVGCHTLKELYKSFSSNPVVVLTLNHEDQQQIVTVLVGVNNGHLLIWKVSLSSGGDQAQNLEEGDAQYVKTSASISGAISKLTMFENKLIIVSFDNGKMVLLDAEALANRGISRVIAKRRFPKTSLGIIEDMLVFDSFTSIPLSTILDDDASIHNGSYENNEEDNLVNSTNKGEDRVGDTHAKTMLYTNEMNSRRTTKRKLLNRPLHEHLIPIDPNSKPRNGRRCCKVPPPPSSSVPEPIKRKVKPPPMNLSRRRPLYENPLLKSTSTNTGQQQRQVPVRLPPFCRSTSNRPNWALPEFYLKETEGNIYTSTVEEK